MPSTVPGNPFLHPEQVLHDLCRALGADGTIDDQTGEPGPLRSCTDSGVMNGDGTGGNLVLVKTIELHGLNSGDVVRIVSTGLYDGTWAVEPQDAYSFQLLGSVEYTADATTGQWEAP